PRAAGTFEPRTGDTQHQQAGHRHLSIKEKPMFDVMSPCDLTDELSSSGTPDVSKDRPSDRDLQRADGCGRVVLIGSENGTRIEDVFERSPIRIMFPRTEHRAVQEAVLINTAGGIAG